MIGQMGSFDRPSADTGDPLELYLHGYVSSRIMNLTRRTPGAGAGAGAEGSPPPRPGLPVCVAASHCDGLVLALSAFSHSYNYRSAILFGHATIVEDKEEKLYAMELITNSVVPDRWRNTRLPPNNSEMQSTSILKVKIVSGSAKIRDGNCHDEQADMQNQEAVDRIWTGVLPIHQVVGEPITGPYNKVDTPAYMTEFISDFNTEQKDSSIKAAQEKS